MVYVCTSIFYGRRHAIQVMVNYDDETNTDGHGFVRLARHRSKQDQSAWDRRYRAQPRAVVDRKGHYLVYRSSLGQATRMDVMILKTPRSTASPAGARR